MWIAASLLARVSLAAGLVLANASSVAAQTRAAAPADTRLTQAAHALSAGDLDRARQLGTAYLKQHPADARALVLMAQVEMARDNYDAAYDALEAALKADPRNVDALYYLGMVAGTLAQQQFHDLETKAPDSALLHELAAEALVAQDKRPAAEKEYEAALARRPDLLESLLGLARLQRIRLACDTAIPLYERAEAIRPTFDGAYGRAMCQSLMQDDEAAVKSFEQAIARDPRQAVAWVGLGSSLNKLNRAKEAIAKLQHAIELEPTMGEAYYALGLTYQSAGQTALAQEAFKKAEQTGGAMGSAPR
jgi:tetratricopeptide (TPR) repeat protein